MLFKRISVTNACIFYTVMLIFWNDGMWNTMFSKSNV